MHVGAGGQTEDGRRVASLGREGHEWNLGILDMRSLRMATPSLAIIRGMADQWEHDYLAREKRTKGVAEALHSGVLDGLSPSPAALQDARDYVDGRRTLEEIIDDVRRRHTRRPEDQS